MASNLLQISNSQGQVVYLQGKFPNGTFGVVADEERPFTNEELTDSTKFEEHLRDLNDRMDRR